MRSQEDNQALLDAMVAVDAAVQTLVVARIILEDRYTGDERVRPPKPLAESLPPVTPLEGCAHAHRTDVSTHAGAMELCLDCGENIGPHS